MDYLETAMEFYSKDKKNTREQEKEEQKRLYIEAVGSDNSMIVDNKPTFEKCFVHDACGSEHITVPNDSKVYIDDLIKKKKTYFQKYKYSPK